MKFRKILSKAICSICVASFGMPMSNFAQETACQANVNEEQPCNQDSLCKRHPAIVAATVALGGGIIAAVIANNNKGDHHHSFCSCESRSSSSSETRPPRCIKRHHHHSDCKKRCHKNTKFDFGQTLTIEGDFAVAEITGGQMTYQLYAISPSQVEFLGTPLVVNSGDVAAVAPFPLSETLDLTIPNPQFGNWVIGVKQDFKPGTSDDAAQTGEISFFVQRSSDGTSVENVYSEQTFFSFSEDHAQPNMVYTYFH